jgi:hypothetical protein
MDEFREVRNHLPAGDLDLDDFCRNSRRNQYISGEKKDRENRRNFSAKKSNGSHNVMFSPLHNYIREILPNVD